MLKQTDTSLLEAALIGYGAERQKIQEKIAEIHARLNGGTRRTATRVADTPKTTGRRRMSAASRKRIGAAQKARWAEYRKKQKAA